MDNTFALWRWRFNSITFASIIVYKLQHYLMRYVCAFGRFYKNCTFRLVNCTVSDVNYNGKERYRPCRLCRWRPDTYDRGIKSDAQL